MDFFGSADVGVGGGGLDDGGSSADALLSSLSSSARRSFASRCVVAVKVRYVGVDRQIFLDFRILKRDAHRPDAARAVGGRVNLEETLDADARDDDGQTDLRVEARNLGGSGATFAARARGVCAPWPVPSVTEGIPRARRTTAATRTRRHFGVVRELLPATRSAWTPQDAPPR